LAARRTGIGGSDVAAIVGVSKYAGPTKVYYDKLDVLPDVDNAAMEWGRRLESAVRGKFADEHPEFHVFDGPGLVSHPERVWQLATVDGLVAEGPNGSPFGVIEVKTGSSNNSEWGEEATDEVPLAYLCQVTWYMDIFGVEVGYLAVLLDGRDYREYQIDYDAQLAAKLRGHAEAFWTRNVLAQIPPQADGLESTAEVLASLHNPAPKSEGQLDVDVLGWAQIYGNAHQDELAAKARKQEAGNHLRAAFLAAGSPQHGLIGDRKIATFSKSAPKPSVDFDADRFAAEHPDLFAAYSTTCMTEPVRRLTVSKEFTS
jgi:putative phage-type endonuclease